MSRFSVVTFDCYGTLIDWEKGIARAFARAARRAGVSLDPARAVRLHAEVEPTLETGPYRPYRDVLAVAAVEVAHRLGWRITVDEGRFLPESIPDWEPFPDTNPALTRLAASGCRLGILSNVDDDLLAATRSRLDGRFDFVVTAERVRSYKPAPAHFAAARRIVGDASWLHAAQSRFHDIAPDRTLGIANAWINRKREAALPDLVPDREFSTLAGLADWIAPA
jgi:2-haloacid dehalogenase/putative hydrolase of the HAD superfamily